MCRETLISEITIPSLSSSPWIRGAPHPTFISAISEISLRTSTETPGRPEARFLLFHRQKSLKPLRCQAKTVAGFTMIRLSRQPHPKDTVDTPKLRTSLPITQTRKLI